jgi:hypothetical protein
MLVIFVDDVEGMTILQLKYWIASLWDAVDVDIFKCRPGP